MILESVSNFNPTYSPQANPISPLETAQELQSIFTRPWQPPKHSVVEEVNKVTQYGAWVLVHGYTINHFTGYVNRPKHPQIWRY